MEIISRKDWGAQHEDGFGAAPLPATRLYLHHSVTIAPDLMPPFIDDDAAVRTLERIGEDRFGRGISYTFAVTPVGRIYQGHGIAREGAHTKGLNSTARAICWIGNYDTARPTQQMIDATVWLVRHGHAQGWWPARFTGGHRDAPAASTACPGRNAYALIGDMNLLAAAPEEDDLTPDQARMLGEIHTELVQRHQTRVDYRTLGEIPPYPLPTETMAGMAIQADARAYEARQIAGLARDAAVDALEGVGGLRELVERMQYTGGVDMDALIRAFADQLAKKLAEKTP